MTVHIFKQPATPPAEDKKEFLQGAISALSYLETSAFKESFYLLRAALRLAQIVAIKELAKSYKYQDIKMLLKNTVDEL